MTDTALNIAERRRSLFAVIASMTVVSVIYGLSVPLLALVLERQGVDSTMIGINTAVQPLATLLIAPIAPRVIRALGSARVMICATLVSALVFILLGITSNIYAWFPLRFLLGAGGSFLWIVGEAWINQISSENMRGRMVGFYTMAGSVGTALGPLVPRTIMADFTRQLVDRDYMFQTFLAGERWDDVADELTAGEADTLWEQFGRATRAIHDTAGAAFGDAR